MDFGMYIYICIVKSNLLEQLFLLRTLQAAEIRTKPSLCDITSYTHCIYIYRYVHTCTIRNFLLSNMQIIIKNASYFKVAVVTTVIKVNFSQGSSEN